MGCSLFLGKKYESMLRSGMKIIAQGFPGFKILLTDT